MARLIEDQSVVLSIPKGLEVASIKTARREHGVRFETFASGLISSKDRARDPQLGTLLETPPIWTFGSFRLIAKAATLDGDGLRAAAAGLAETVAALGWSGKAYWLDPGTGPVRAWAIRLLRLQFGLRNDPTNYEITLRVVGDDNGAHVLLGSSISVRKRFAYRHADVGASINPVLAACFVRLLPKELNGRAVDPTCGSGTLLFERLKYSNETSGLGIDISNEAQSAFATNLRAIDLAGREVNFTLGSSMDPDSWRSCSSVISNLPFGIRTRTSAGDLDRLYLRILENACANLDMDGRILLTSSYKRGLEGAAAAMEGRLEILSKYRTEMGGLFYQVFVFARSR